jgi:hypothetical protein
MMIGATIVVFAALTIPSLAGNSAASQWAQFLPASIQGYLVSSAEGPDDIRPLMAAVHPVMTAGTCDTAGPIEVESSGGTTDSTAYATLKAAFDAIDAGTHTGSITIDVCGDTSEGTATAALSASGTSSASYTSITISPAGGAARTISGATTAGSPMVDLNGADNVTINGLNSGGNSLTIANTTNSATSGTATIRFIGGATNNTITNSTILGSVASSVATNGATIFFSTDGSTASGNDNNTISNNNIGPAGANLPTKGVLCNGSTSTQAIGNSGLVIDNNNIYDYFGAAVTSSGVAVNGGCNTFSITNNRFYQTAARTWTTGATHRAIDLNSQTATSGVQGMTVTGNIVGYASNTQTGTYALSGSTGKFQGIVFAGITGAASSNISGNTVANVSLTGGTSSGTTTSTPFAGIMVSNGATTVNNNTIGSQSATGSLLFSTTTTSGTDIYGIFNFGSDAWTTNSNNVGGITANNAGASGAFIVYGMRGWTGSTVTWTANSNVIGGTVAASIQNNSTSTTAQLIGINMNAAASTLTGNTVRNLTAAGGTGTVTSASVIGISSTGTSANQTVAQNTIFNLSNTNATAANFVTGIQFNGSTANVVERNLIHSLTAATSSTSAEVNGIRVAGGTTVYRNNMIAVGAGIANAIPVNGINEASGTNTFFHNSVYVGGSPTAGAGNSFAFNSLVTTNTRSYRDNIFFNARSNNGATGKNYIVQVGGSAPNPTGLTVNNNVYFANGSGAVFGRFSTLDVAGLAAWKTAVGQDANSFEANPQYVDPTANTPDLHLSPTVPTIAEGNGADVGVANDFDGQTRSGLTPVDIGADAGDFATAGDVIPPVISYATLGNTTSTTDRTLSISVTDSGSGVPTSGVGLPVVYFKKGTGAGAYSSSQCLFTGGSGYDCTISSASLGGVAAGDTIQYYVVAQDASSNVGANPSAGAGNFTANPPAAGTPPTTPNQYLISQSIGGTKTVCDSGCDYTTLTGATGLFNAINTGVITGNVNIEISSDLTAEDGNQALNPLSEEPAGSNYTIRIYPTGGARAISGSSATSLIRLNAADRVTIDGSIGGTGTDRSLTITNTNAGTSSAVIWLQSNAADGAQNNTIKNLNVVGSGNTQTLFGIGIGSSTVALSSLGSGNNSNTIQNNSVSKTQYGIYTQGASAAAKNTGNVISHNLINTASPNNVAKGGIITGFENSIQITDNNVSGISQTASPDVFGISLGQQSISTSTFTGNEVTNATVTGNFIGTVRNTGTFSACGLCVTPATSGTNLIANNVLTGVAANGTSGDFSVGMLIGGGTGSTTNIYYNSIAMSGTQTGGSDKSYALAIGGSNPAVDIRNNALYNTQSNGTGNNYAIAFGYSTFTNLTSNNNDLFVSPDAAHFVGATASLSGPTNQPTLANLQTATGKDTNSISTDPMFNNPAGNLQPQIGSPLVNAGTPVSVTTDILGATRNASTPTIGAYETALDTVGPVIAYTPFINTTDTSNRTLSITASDPNGVDSGANAPRIYFRKSTDPAYVSTQCSGSGADYTCTIDHSLIGGVSTGDAIQYFVVAQDMLGNVGANPGAGFTATSVNNVTNPPTTPASYLISVSYTGTYTVDGVGGSGNFASLTNPGGLFAALNAGVLTGNITINITADLTGETGVVSLEQQAEEGAGAGTYTVLIKPSGGPRSITGSSATSLIKLNGADRVTIDGSTAGGLASNLVGGDASLRELTITNTGAGAVIWIATNATSGATDNTVRNCSLVGPGNFAGQGVIAGSGATFGGGAENGHPNSNNTIQNNRITRVQNAVYTSGDPVTRDQNWTIAENDAGSATTADKLTFRGFLIAGADNFAISQNRISGVNSSTSTSSTMSGIQIAGIVSGGAVTRNEIKDIRQNNTTGWGSNGIYVTAASTASNLLIANNFVSGIASQGFNGNEPTDNGYGIVIEGGGSGFNIYNNTVVMTGNQITATGITAALLIDDSITAAGAVDLRNNILANTQTVGTQYSVYVDTPATNAVFSSIDNNDYFSTDNVGNLGGTVRATLSAWQTATGSDAASRAEDPLFVSATDFHLQPSSTLLGAGTSIAAVTVDIDGEARDNPPDIGADEIPAPLVGTFEFSAPTYNVGEGGGIASLTVNRSGGSAGSVTVHYSFTDGTNALTSSATGGSSCAAGVDFVNSTTTIDFADGETSKSIAVSICDDSVYEGTENFSVTLTSVTAGTIGTQNSAVVDITDNDPVPAASINVSPSTVGFGNVVVGTTSTGQTVTILNNGTADLSVGAMSVSGTDAGDFGLTGATSGDVITPGNSIQVTVTFTPSALGSRNATLNIPNNSPNNPSATASLGGTGIQQGTLQFSTTAYSGPEGANVTVTVTRTGDSAGSSTVDYAATGGTATAGTCGQAGIDYHMSPGTLTFGPGETSKTFGVTLCGDLESEDPAETIVVSLSNATGGVLGANSSATVTVFDAAGEFRNPAPLQFSPSGPVALSTLNVTGYVGPVSGLRVTLYGVTAVSARDLDALLVSPNGTKFVVTSRVGGDNPLADATLTFEDTAADYMPSDSAITLGRNYKPTTCVTPVSNFGNPAPSGPYVEPGCSDTGINPTFASAFGGVNPTGTWTLYVRDNTGLVPGPVSERSEGAVANSISGGWGLQFLVPTAPAASVSGRVRTPDGGGIVNAAVTIEGGGLESPITVVTSAFGKYRFDNIPTGQTYIVTVRARRHNFAIPTRMVSVMDDLSNVDFVGDR